MPFWPFTIVRYALAAIAAIVISIPLSILITLPFGKPGDDIGIGILSFIVFLLAASLVVPFCLGVTAEWIERKLYERRFQWQKALSRFLLGTPILAGWIYRIIWVAPIIKRTHPVSYHLQEALWCCLSVLFSYLALRIRLPQKPLRRFQEGPGG
jgi:hypothetical protein